MYAHAVRNGRAADQMAEIKDGNLTAHERQTDNQQVWDRSVAMTATVPLGQISLV